MKNYQTLIGLALVAAAIVAAALILRNGNGRFQSAPGGSGHVFVIDTQTGKVSIGTP